MLWFAKSKINLSSDLWTSQNGFHYCSIVAHFVNQDSFHKVALLGLPRVLSPHSGENIASCITKIINEYEIGSKLGCFVMDNAGDNDTCIEALAKTFAING